MLGHLYDWNLDNAEQLTLFQQILNTLSNYTNDLDPSLLLLDASIFLNLLVCRLIRFNIPFIYLFNTEYLKGVFF